MSGLFGVVTKNPCVTDLFYGTDYHSHHLTSYQSLMSSYELPFRLLSKKTAIVLLFFINRLLLLRYVFVIGHLSVSYYLVLYLIYGYNLSIDLQSMRLN